ncbi:MAG: aldehyde dehydrogenase family protein [Gammaproteobacteria bacterium]|nr:aldehyde dehydrogenase family protein [Gammaproteobacteria bacterium]
MRNDIPLLIASRRETGESGTFEVRDPGDESVAGLCPAASPAQLERAVAAAEAAFARFKDSKHDERRALLHAIADRIEAHAEELAELVTREQGKPLPLARFEVGGAAAWARHAASLDIPETVLEDSEERRIVLCHRPLGVVGSITPWNWPLLIAIWHLVPALRAGNAVVMKPSELTPLSTLRLVELVNEVAPRGLVNSVSGGAEIGSRIAAHEGIRKLVFTGSTATGQAIVHAGAGNLKRLTLELGGNDAAIVLPDADPDAIAEGLFATAFLNMGQTCAALKRLYVPESLHDAIAERLAGIAGRQVLGHGLDSGTTFGPVQNPVQLAKVEALVADARARGGRVLCGGERLARDGYFYPPTIVTHVEDGARLVDEEQFGPVLPLVRYRDLDEAVVRANRSELGLGGSVWGQDIELAERTAARLECGTVWINSHAEVMPHVPFGGAKRSGVGMEFGVEGLLEYTQTQVVHRKK